MSANELIEDEPKEAWRRHSFGRGASAMLVIGPEEDIVTAEVDWRG